MGGIKRLSGPSGSYFGPRSRKPSIPNGIRRKQRKPIRFVSKPMKKIEEEVKRAHANIQSIMGRKDIGANIAYEHNSKICPSNEVTNELHKGKDQQGSIYGGKDEQRPNVIEDFPPMVVSPKFGHAFSSDRPVKPTLVSSMSLNTKQRTLHANDAKMPSSQSKNLKAMPGLVLNRKGRLNLDQVQATWMRKRDRVNDCDDVTNDGNLGSRKELLSEEKPGACHDNGGEAQNPIQGMIKKRRKYIDTNEDDNDVQSPKVDSTRSTSQDDTMKDCHDKVSTPFVVDCLKKQCYCCSKPTDEPIWRGILNIGNKEYIPLYGHFSTKSCEKVREFTKSLSRVVEVTKLPMSKVWPKKWEGSKPMDDNIGLYFFPHKMRPDKSYDQLLKEVMDNDLALRAIIGDIEMLMFPSSLLPERYQTFQMKHYLWGVFKPKEVEGKQVVAQHQRDNTTANAIVTGIATDAACIPTGVTGVAIGSIPTEDAVNVPTAPANHGRIDSSMGAAPSRMLAFVIKQTPRLEQLIREMQQEGALIMQGEMMSTGSWQDNIASAMQSGQPSKTWAAQPK